MNTKLLIIPAAMAAAVLATPAPAQDYKIGISAGLTGYAATVDRAWRDGVEVAVATLNAKGGVMGRKLAVVTEDNRSEPQEAVGFLTRRLLRLPAASLQQRLARPRLISLGQLRPIMWALQGTGWSAAKAQGAQILCRSQLQPALLSATRGWPLPPVIATAFAPPTRLATSVGIRT